jgi:hypothetical protein
VENKFALKFHKNHTNAKSNEEEPEQEQMESSQRPSFTLGPSTSGLHLSTASTITLNTEDQHNVSFQSIQSSDSRQSTITGSFSKINQYKAEGKKEQKIITSIAYRYDCKG